MTERTVCPNCRKDSCDCRESEKAMAAGGFKRTVLPEELAALAPRYDVERRGAESWRLWCRRCSAGYALDRGSAGYHPGNVLKLLDHAAGHEVKRPRLVKP